MFANNSSNEVVKKIERKIVYQDCELKRFSMQSKFTVSEYLLFLKKGDSFELIRINGVDADLANSFSVDKRSIAYSVLKGSTDIVSQKELVGFCKESVFFHKESGKRIKQEIDYWEKLGLGEFYAVRDKIHGMIGFVVFSFGKKLISNSNLKKFQAYIDDAVKYTYEGVRTQSIKNELFMYKGLYVLLKDFMEKKNNCEERIFNYFQEVLDSKAAVMYLLQGKHYVPFRYKQVSFIKPIQKKEIMKNFKVSFVNVEKESQFFEEMGVGPIIVFNILGKMLLVYKTDVKHIELDKNFLIYSIDILEKFLNE